MASCKWSNLSRRVIDREKTNTVNAKKYKLSAPFNVSESVFSGQSTIPVSIVAIVVVTSISVYYRIKIFINFTHQVIWLR